MAHHMHTKQRRPPGGGKAACRLVLTACWDGSVKTARERHVTNEDGHCQLRFRRPGYRQSPAVRLRTDTLD